MVKIPYMKRAFVNSKFRHDIGSFTLNFSCKFSQIYQIPVRLVCQNKKPMIVFVSIRNQIYKYKQALQPGAYCLS